MIKEKIVEVTEKRHVAIALVCDVCGKDIPANKETAGKPKYRTQKFMEVTTGHNDWGNDSVDSVEVHHICSTECMDKFMRNFYMTFCNNSDSATDYIEINSAKRWIDTEPNCAE